LGKGVKSSTEHPGCYTNYKRKSLKKVPWNLVIVLRQWSRKKLKWKD